MRSGSSSLATFDAVSAKPMTASFAGAVAALIRALSLRLALRADGVPLRSRSLTCLRADPIGSAATSLAVLAAPNATSSTVDVMSVLMFLLSPDIDDATQHNALRHSASRATRQLLYEPLGGLPENVVMGYFATFLGLDPLRPQAALAAPGLQVGAQADHMEEGPLPRHASNRRAVVVVEIAMHRNAAGLREGDRPLDL